MIILAVVALVITSISIEINTRVTREQNNRIIELLKQLNEK